MPVIVLLAVITVGTVVWLGAEAYLNRRNPIVVDLQGASTEQEDAIPGGMLSTRRIRVWNRGRSAISAVHVRVESSAPQSAPFYPIYLEMMHGAVQPFELGAGQHEFIDVVRFNSTYPTQELWLAHDRKLHPQTANGFALQRLTLFIAVQTNERKDTHKFVAYRDRRGRLRLEHVDRPKW
jgi:hypothetical protein